MENKNSIYIIRHGESGFNKALQESRLRGDDIEYRFRKDLVDCELTDLGIQQAKEAGEKLKDINISLVLVSPLRRTLQTAYYAFKDHPSKPKFKIILLGREVMSCCSSFPSDIETLQKEFPFVDFSELDAVKDRKLWILDTFEGEDRELLESLVKDLPDVPDRFEKFSDVLLETSKKIYPKNFESNAHLASRGKKLRMHLQTQCELLRESGKLAYVGHEVTSLILTATKFDEKMYALDGIKLKNAEFIEYFFDKELCD